MAKAKHRCTWNQAEWIDADFMSSWSAFQPGRSEILEFDGNVSDMAFKMSRSSDSFTVTYHVPCSTGEALTVHNIVEIDRRPRHFGGHRVYFRCPGCGKRVLRLALTGKGLRCNVCAGITWQSRRMKPLDRKISRANQLSQQLGVDNWLSAVDERPRYMRQKKFLQLQEKRSELVREIYGSIPAKHAAALSAFSSGS